MKKYKHGMSALLNDERPDNYIDYVENLRKTYKVRVEVKNLGHTLEAHLEKRNKLVKYLTDTLSDDDWEMQLSSGHLGLHYFWFTKKEDALAFALKFYGKVV